MRIVGGSAKSRIIQTPKGRDTRPMTDETREAVFNILGPIDGFNVLDAYAGSGAVGLEAISRGAAHVDGVEKAREAVSVIRRNVKDLGFEDSYEIWQQSVEEWAKRHQERIGKYDLIFADPPFDKLDNEALSALAPYIELNGLLILKHSNRINIPAILTLDAVQTRQYGDSAVTFYRLKSA